jgi:hypothetical protein
MYARIKRRQVVCGIAEIAADIRSVILYCVYVNMYIANIAFAIIFMLKLQESFSIFLHLSLLILYFTRRSHYTEY